MTTVEFLIKEINKLTGLNISMDEPCIDKAKEMEKEQIMKAFDDGIEEGIMRGQSEEYNIEYYVSADRYYNETFKSE